tara:strand:+ start:8530 stop:9300 length:771 start_codon:yes stop_codon:yes gene_type:complete
MRDSVGWGIFFFKVFVISLVVLGFSYWQSQKLPTKFVSLEHLQKEPLQTETSKKSFTTETNGHIYQIDPVFDYEIWGVVVADHNSDSWLDNTHESWGDYINTKDICVIWGANILNPQLDKLNFSHGSFTCYVNTKSSQAWQSFNKEKLSNNHLIPANKEIEQLIRKSHIGDEIRMKGQLVNYNVNGGPFRKSSTVRTDMENGACEIIYVNEFETFARNNKIWFFLVTLSKITAVLSLLAGLAFVFLVPFTTSTHDG